MIFIKKVTSFEGYKDFVNFPFKLYKNSKYWVPPISNEELEMMDKTKNPVFCSSSSCTIYKCRWQAFVAVARWCARYGMRVMLVRCFLTNADVPVTMAWLFLRPGGSV